MKKLTIEKEDVVKLKPIAGIPPTTYVPILYIVGILAAFFLLCMLPGTIRGGSYLVVDTNVDNCAVYVDDHYIGESGVPHFVDKGTYTITVRKPYFAEATIEAAAVPANIFFTIFYRRETHFTADTSIADTSGYLSWRLSQVEQWAPIKQFSENYFLPQIFTETAKDLVTAGDPQDTAVVPFFTYALSYLNSEEMKADYEAGLSLLPDTVIETITSSIPYSRYHSGSVRSEGITASGSYDTLTIDGMNYLEVTSDESFYIASTEMTEEVFAQFLIENPSWDVGNTDSLIAEGLVDELYLDGIDVTAPANRPVRNISYAAVGAFIDWYGNTLKSEGYDVELFLPTEEQWYAAAAAYAAESGYVRQLLSVTTPAKELFGMFGSLWEMTDTSYLFHPELIDDETRQTAGTHLDLPAGLLTVKGGSYANDGVTVETRGMVEAASCSPFIGFRTAVRIVK